APVRIDPSRTTDACGRSTGAVASGSATICLAYHPCLGPAIGDTEGASPDTIVERYAVLVSDGEPAPYEPACARPDLFQPGPGEIQANTGELYARLLGLVNAACADVSDPTSVVLGQVAVRSSGPPLSDADVAYTGRRVVLNTGLLFDVVLC